MLSPNMVAKSFKEEYKLGPVLGQGYYATVNKVYRNKKYFAVKQIRKDKFKYQPKALEQFTREISILMSLEYHPGIVGIINVYDERDVFQIVMEYICEGNLLSFINDTGKLSEENTKIIFKQFLHDVGIVHRDLKPENKSREKHKVKICDFGLATLHCSLAELTTACGSRNYVAPEILNLPQYRTNTNTLDPKEPTVSYGKECDLWSLGVILYVCLSRTFPFNINGDISERNYILSGQFGFGHHVWKSISVEAKDLIKCLLKVDTNERITAKDALNHPWMIET
ncbi:hypothetical protein INT48_008945 [Thamnidium elegans]|uniref:Protein kinase domain-containing protein n=1 Tax=Thamnidium elegans TaxID=101142 RepID=A0A8H7STM3_9FUNG|nr:hypothetical protein INT48_008945 [Thamnidium elegans]